MTNVKDLELDNCSLSIINSCPNISKLSITVLNNLYEFPALDPLPNLEELTIIITGEIYSTVLKELARLNLNLTKMILRIRVSKFDDSYDGDANINCSYCEITITSNETLANINAFISKYIIWDDHILN